VRHKFFVFVLVVVVVVAEGGGGVVSQLCRVLFVMFIAHIDRILGLTIRACNLLFKFL
jgi:hypothetical protein